MQKFAAITAIIIGIAIMGVVAVGFIDDSDESHMIASLDREANDLVVKGADEKTVRAWLTVHGMSILVTPLGPNNGGVPPGKQSSVLEGRKNEPLRFSGYIEISVLLYFDENGRAVAHKVSHFRPSL